MVTDGTTSAAAPVSALSLGIDREEVAEGTALSLSGGGYRAMVFHLGALVRLNETGTLRMLARVSSVSGGSITAAWLGLSWRRLRFVGQVAENLNEVVVGPLRELASRTIDVGAIVKGLFLSGSVGERLAAAYDKYLFGGATLADLPSDDEGPRFVLNATNVQSGALWRFSRPFMADYLVGLVRDPKLRLAVAVAASSAFPPFLSPTVFRLLPEDFEPVPKGPLQRPPFTTKVVLTDGGVYDNLGLETTWKRYRTILVSDGGGKLSPEPTPRRNWLSHSYRVLNVVDNQVRSLRKRQLINSYQITDGPDARRGAYWGIRTNIRDYGLADAWDCPHERTLRLAETPTRLKAMPARLQEWLINWGYAVCDAALRRHVCGELPRPARLPYPESGI